MLLLLREPLGEHEYQIHRTQTSWSGTALLLIHEEKPGEKPGETIHLRASGPLLPSPASRQDMETRPLEG